jgi:hypothetical protein
MRTPESAELLVEIKEAMSRLKNPTLEEVNTLAAEISSRRNRTPRECFCGLSPEIMVRFLHFPFESPQLIDFPMAVSSCPIDTMMEKLFLLLVSEIGEKGVKTTVTGNLPRAVVFSIAEKVLDKKELEMLTDGGFIRSETDWLDLHVTRIIAVCSGMVRKIHGRFVVTKSCQQLLRRSGMSEIYPRLFKAYIMKFNWAYLFRMVDTRFTQTSFAYSLYLINLFGSDWRSASFYEDAHLKAFPQLIEEGEYVGHGSAEEQIRWSYTQSIFNKLGRLFGLVELSRNETRFSVTKFEVKKTKLFDELVRFNVTPGG